MMRGRVLQRECDVLCPCSRILEAHGMRAFQPEPDVLMRLTSGMMFRAWLVMRVMSS